MQKKAEAVAILVDYTQHPAVFSRYEEKLADYGRFWACAELRVRGFGAGQGGRGGESALPHTLSFYGRWGSGCACTMMRKCRAWLEGCLVRCGSRPTLMLVVWQREELGNGLGRGEHEHCIAHVLGRAHAPYMLVNSRVNERASGPNRVRTLH